MSNISLVVAVLILASLVSYDVFFKAQYRVGMLVDANISFGIPGQPGRHNIQMLVSSSRLAWASLWKFRIQRYYNGTVLKPHDGKIVVSTYIYNVEENCLSTIKGLE
ncbi:MAG: hypothetical protein UW27_C0003G0046 [Parcubacteria group bacterium GW2011_GWA1_44_13]|uniref:Uncharacterized protein n=1 Tax=Candidatus Nomurabacteria bacterium GW2011_GWB1_44_12 TaxID=1618748 RepID=A0A837I7B2_9BACT|nr:MAG: hypothetical protein UW17_C0001G0003 [Candidatus Nomurabacteria bacterium GW2011_GWD1_44_10]KKT36599.1 MAG: hypothetical protein UW25_C0005G0081 [Candidatus Nomurabacteria bacterium GW2011_GWB1_44_12]KKT38298.1 MAG: hypothetical protein UW27_C0003G0046 [Parcubacteria group bacterium GW2011_GWA1_44_13]KKT59659.1 MAG: hypothetical protein UW54_C0022G0016 [Parcubacteria group bacterium GW2011_GWC1_44_26]HBB44218.1 hypothetical protein [Candidatus Yonathbacteria bacterium]